MKICVFGAWAIGGYMAAELAMAGHEVCAIARGAHLAAIRSHGLKLIADGETRTVRLPVSDDPAAFGPQDVVICALKAQQAHASAGAFAPLLGPRTAVLTAMNGIPWWYFYKQRGSLDGHHVESVDAGAAQWNAIGPERAIGCVVDPACEVVAPGVIEHRLYKRFTIGEPDGSRSHHRPAGCAGFGRIRCADPRRDPLEHLAQALGQCLLQPDQRPDSHDPRSHHRRARLAGPLQRHDGRSAGRRGSARRYDSRGNDGAATECSRCRRRPQNVDAARSRTWSILGDRCPRHRRPGTRAPRRRRNANDRRGACAGTGARPAS
jgi:hypothetical protein